MIKKKHKPQNEDRLLVHVDKNGRELKSLENTLVLANKALYISKVINPKIKPDDDPLNLVGFTNKYLKGNITIPIKLDKSADLVGKRLQYNQILKIHAELSDSPLFLKYLKYIELVKGAYVLNNSFEQAWKDQHSVWLTDAKEVALYRQVQKVIDEWQKAIRMSNLTDETNLGWRLRSAFKLMTMDGNTKPIPDYAAVKELTK